jgi:putative ABC transport system permease protein
MPELMRKIDERFANSESPVRAMTEQAFRQMFTEMLGNIRLFIRNIAIIVVAALVCVTGNAMAMSLRERTREVAVLKAIGFSRFIVLTLVLFEAVVIAVTGGLLGVLIAKFFFRFADMSGIGIPGFSMFYVPVSTMIFSMLLAASIGLASGIIPAWRAAQISVVDGLRRVV